MIYSASPTFVEIGVLHGGSLLMWKEYFGNSARIMGIIAETTEPKTRAKKIIKADTDSKKETKKV